MRINEFGKLVRQARYEAQINLTKMARELKVSATFLIFIETGKKAIPDNWPSKVEEYFSEKGIKIKGLREAAYLENRCVPIEGLSPEHQRLVARLACYAPNSHQQLKLYDLLNEIAKSKRTE